MRKLAALLLAVVLLCTALPAMALDLLPAGDTYPLQTDATITWYAESNLTPHEAYTDYTQSPFHTGLSDMTGVDIQWIFPPVGSDAPTFTNTLLADPGSLPNIMQVYWMNDAALYLEDEVIWDLTPYIQEYAPAYYAFLQSKPAYDRLLKTDDGQYYAFGYFKEGGGWNNTYMGPVIRTDWLEECGLEIPRTVSEFENVIRVFNEKYGAKFAFANNRFRESGISGSFGAFGAANTTQQWFALDGVVDLAQVQPEWRDYVSWLNMLWEDGLIDQDSLALDDTTVKGKIHNDMCGISITSMGQMSNWNKEREAEGLEPVWTGIQYPTGDDGTLVMVPGGTGVGTTTTVISKNTDEETMKLCLQILDYAYTDDGFLYWNFGKEGVSWEYDAEGKPQLTALVTDNPSVDPIVKYTGSNWNSSCIQATQLLYLKNSPEAIAANDIWFYPNEDVTSYYKVEGTFTVEEADELAFIGDNISTYVRESFEKFLTGALDIDDDAQWESYLANYTAYGLERTREIRQACYDRYLNR